MSIKEKWYKIFQEDKYLEDKYKSKKDYYKYLENKYNYEQEYDNIGRLHRQFISENKKEFVTTEQRIDKNGNVLSSVQKLLPVESPYIPEDFEVVRISEHSSGSYWKIHTKQNISKETIIERLDSRLNHFKPIKFKEKKYKNNNNIAVLNMFDAHLDKIAIKSRVGYNSSLEDNIKRYKLLFDDILQKTYLYKPEQIIFPIGSDLFHTNSGNKTKKGTQIEYYCDENEAYEIICNLQIECVSILLDIAPVYVPFIKGNHDEDKVNIMSYWLDKVFSDNKHWQCDNSKEQRKYKRYGVNLLGFAHGDKEKNRIHNMPLYMAEEQKEYWYKTKYRKFYLGDLHHNFEYKFLKGKDFIGCNVEFLRSVGCQDSWHSDNGYIGIPITAESNIWNKENGNIADVKSNIIL